VRLFINLTPSVPLSLSRRGGHGYVREAKPLFDSPYSGKVIRGVLEGRSHMIRRCSYHNYLPLIKGKGDKGGWGYQEKPKGVRLPVKNHKLNRLLL